MEMFIILAFLLLVGMQNLVCVIIGLKIGLALNKGESFSLPNPIKEYAEQQAKRQAKKEAKAEQDKIETILKNIENYDGTGFGQMDVPRG
jgi:hypothetical protein